jgi:hypothetical protein
MGHPVSMETGINRNLNSSGRSRTGDNSACSGALPTGQSNSGKRAKHRWMAAQKLAGAHPKAHSPARRSSLEG